MSLTKKKKIEVITHPHSDAPLLFQFKVAFVLIDPNGYILLYDASLRLILKVIDQRSPP